MEKIISVSKADQKEEIKRLWDVCFDDGQAFTDWFFDEVFCSDNALVCSVGGKVASALQIFYYDVFWNGKNLRAGYIAGLSTYKKYRNCGFASELMNKSFEVMKEKGCDISLLIPFNFDFYRKYGYECIGYRSEYKGNICLLDKFCKTSFAETEYVNAPISEYNAFVENKKMYILRDESFFSQMHTNTLLSGGKITTFKDGGYIVWFIKNREFYSQEIVYKSTDELYGILSFIYSKRNVADTFRLRTAADGRLWRNLSESGITEIRYPADMIKILDGSCFKFSDDICDNYFNMLGWV